MVTVLRHKTDPLSFKIIAINFEDSEEFVLDMRERDLFELTEGRLSILEQEEPNDLINLMIDNLVLVTKD